MTPTVGRIVLLHHAEDGKDWPAIVLDTKPNGSAIYLQVFRARGNYFTWAAEGPTAGLWSWPPREAKDTDDPTAH
jgi:hypothetical protein